MDHRRAAVPAGAGADAVHGRRCGRGHHHERMTAQIRPSTAADFIALMGHRPAYRGRFVTIEENGELLALGGVLFRPDGVWASAVISDRARARPVTLHKAGLRVFREALAMGFRPIFVTP